MIKKEEIRLKIKSEREKLNRKIKKDLDKKIKENFLKSKYFENSKLIFIYVNMESEIDTLSIISEAIKKGKRVAVPKVFPKLKIMRALEITSLLDLNESGAFGILEPNIDSKDVSEEVDLVILPGLAFDEWGNRVGYGAGFYDKFLSQYNNLKKVALSYEFQIVPKIPKEEFDYSVNAIITETNVLNIEEN